MGYDLKKLLVIGISSRALFDLDEEDTIFKTKGLQAFLDHGRKNEDKVLMPGSAFPLVRGLLQLNEGADERRVEVILLSRNHPDISLRVFSSIKNYNLDITRSALTGGAPLGPYLKAFNVGLFLSQSVPDVQSAANQGVAAGLIYSAPAKLRTTPPQTRIAFDGDCVLFSDEAQKIYDEGGLPLFHKHEQEKAKIKLPDGPFAKFIRNLAEMQGPDPDKSPVRIALLTDRNAPADERVIRTLRGWSVRLDEAFFLGGASKTEVLKAFKADMFFDDVQEYCDSAAAEVPTSRVLMPTTEAQDRPTASGEIGIAKNSAGEAEFLLISQTYLKRDYSKHETELMEWYRLNVRTWPEENRSAFHLELEESVQGTPRGKERRAAARADKPKEKFISFLNNLLEKHRP